MALPDTILSKQNLKRIAIGTVVGGVALAALTRMKKARGGVRAPTDTGLSVSTLCNTYEVTNRSKLERTFSDIVNSRVSEGAHDAQAISVLFLRAVAPACVASSKPANPGQALLRFLTWVDTAQELERLRVTTPDQMTAEVFKAKAWAVENGVSPSHPALRDPDTAGLVDTVVPGEIQITCEPPLVAVQTSSGDWECACPPGRSMTLIERDGVMQPECV
jgi:hypothetical protein